MHLLIVFWHTFLCNSHNNLACIQRPPYLIGAGDVETLNPTHRAEEMPGEILVFKWILLGLFGIRKKLNKLARLTVIWICE